MNIPYRIFSLIFFLIGLIFLGYAVIQKEITVGIFVFFPFIVGSGPHMAVSVLLFFCAFATLFFSFHNNGKEHQSQHPNLDSLSDKSRKSSSASHTQSGGIILIGPIPLVFGSTKKMVITLLCIAIILLIFIMFILPLIHAI